MPRYTYIFLLFLIGFWDAFLKSNGRMLRLSIMVVCM